MKKTINTTEFTTVIMTANKGQISQISVKCTDGLTLNAKNLTEMRVLDSKIANSLVPFETKTIEYSVSFDSEIVVRFVLERDFNTEHFSAMVYINSEVAYLCHSVFAEETSHKITNVGLTFYIGPNETIKAIRDTCPETGKFLVRFEDNCDYVKTSHNLIGLVNGDKIDWQSKN